MWLIEILAIKLANYHIKTEVQLTALKTYDSIFPDLLEQNEEIQEKTGLFYLWKEHLKSLLLPHLYHSFFKPLLLAASSWKYHMAVSPDSSTPRQKSFSLSLCTFNYGVKQKLMGGKCLVLIIFYFVFLFLTVSKVPRVFLS